MTTIEKKKKSIVEEAIEQADRAMADDLRRKKIKRNARCPCGSGLKFKQCCMRRF